MKKKLVSAVLALGVGLGSFSGSALANRDCQDAFLNCTLFMDLDYCMAQWRACEGLQ